MKLSTSNYGNLAFFRLWNPSIGELGLLRHQLSNENSRMAASFSFPRRLKVSMLGAHNPDAKENVRYMFE